MDINSKRSASCKYVIYNTHGHKLRFPPSKKAQFVTVCGIKSVQVIKMLVILKNTPPHSSSTGALSTLNSLWLGKVHRSMMIPQLGHLMLAFPMDHSSFSFAGISVASSHYLFLSPRTDHQPLALNSLDESGSSSILVLWLGPMFIKDMASFLGIPPKLENLLHDLPLLQGDRASSLVIELAEAYRANRDSEVLEDLCFEIIGEVIHSMRVRHQALQKLTKHKQNTVEDLLPRLLQARQTVEARFTDGFKARDIAELIGLSEFHFIRLYKAAFGITLRQHVINLRLDFARRALEEPETSITDIGFQAGYGSPSSFIHAFSKRFGHPPSQYRAFMKISRI